MRTNAWISYEDLASASSKLESMLPTIDAVVGISRSGLIPATVVSCARHVPLMICTGQSIEFAGYGERMSARESPPQTIVVVDDSVSSGDQMRRAVKLVQRDFPCTPVLTAAAFSHVDGSGRVDYFAEEVGGRPFFCWTWPNSFMMESAAVDMDGVLCVNLDASKCDNGPMELGEIVGARPLYVPRRSPIPMVVTARDEKHRPQTEAWLAAHGIRYDKLVMRGWPIGPRDSYEERISRWKAGIYKESFMTLFVESEEFQSRIIAEMSGKPVLCVGSKAMY